MTQQKNTQPNESRPLQRRHREFVEAYIANGCNAAAAARAVRYSQHSARSSGHAILHRPDVQAEVRARLHEAGVNRHRILQELAAAATGADIAEFEAFLAGDVTLEDLKARKVNTKLIRRVRLKINKHGEKDISIEMVDALRAQEKLARLMGLGTSRRQENKEEEPAAQEDPADALTRALLLAGPLPPEIFGGSLIDRSVPPPVAGGAPGDASR